MVIIIVFIQSTNYLSLSCDSRNRSPNLLKTKLLLPMNGRHSDELLPQPPLLVPYPLPLPHGQVAVQMNVKLNEQDTEGEDSSLSLGLGQIIAGMSLSAQLHLPDHTP